MRELAKVAYEAYAKHYRWSSPETGHDLAEFNEIEPEDQLAWEVAVRATIIAYAVGPDRHEQNQ